MNDADSVELRPVVEDDLPLMSSLLNDPSISAPYQWFGWRDTTRFAREHAETGMLGPDIGRLMVTDGADTLGVVSWRKIETSHVGYYWNIGILLLPQARGRGIGTRAQRLLTRYLFAHTPVERIEADTEKDNIAEQRSLEKAGFTREGILRKVVFRDGRWRDGVIYGILREDVRDGLRDDSRDGIAADGTAADGTATEG